MIFWAIFHRLRAFRAVLTAGGILALTSCQFTWNNPSTGAPQIFAISPSSEGLAGGLPVTISGNRLLPNAKIFLGGSPCLSITPLAKNTLSCLPPAHAAGAVDVLAINPDGQQVLLPGGFQYWSYGISIGSFGPFKGGSTVTLSWALTSLYAAATQNFTVETSLDGTTWSTLSSSVASANGPLNNQSFSIPWTIPASTNVATAKFRVSYTDSQGVPTSQTSSAFVIDSTPPAIAAGSLKINGSTASGTITSANNFLQVSFQAGPDNLTNITHFCFKVNTTTPPALSNTCWTPVNAPSPGLTPGLSLNLASFPYPIGFVPGTYSMYVYVRDQAGNINSLTAAGSGTLAQDKASVIYNPGSPPIVINVTGTRTDTPGSPLSSADLTVPTNSNVYIKWNASFTNPVGATPIALYYTQDDKTYTQIAANLPNSASGGCTVDGVVNTGCYVWNLGALSGYTRFRVAAQDSNGMVTFSSSPPINVSQINILAGNTDPGLGSSAVSAILFNEKSNPISPDPQSFVVTDNGVLYFRDAIRGILSVDPSDGVLKQFIPTTGTSTGDGGPATSATLKAPYKVILDYSNHLLIYDFDRIRMVDLSVNPPTISTYIGGGTTANPPDGVSPTSMKFAGFGAGFPQGTKSMPFSVLPNGDVYFMSENLNAAPASGGKIRVFQKALGQVNSITAGGTGDACSGTDNISALNSWGFAPRFDLTTSLISYLYYVAVETVPGDTLACGASLNLSTYQSQTPIPNRPASSDTAGQYTLSGHDGNIYEVNKIAQVLQKLDPLTNTWSAPIIGVQGQTGSCADGTLATACKVIISDAFISAQGQVYFMDDGKLRTIDSNGKVVTILGQGFNFGDGGNPLSARFGRVLSFDQWGAGSKIVVMDSQENRFREFAIGGTTVSTIAGNGSLATPSAAKSDLSNLAATPLATSLGVQTNAAGIVWDDFVANPTSGDIYFQVGTTGIGRLDRSSGKWVYITGGGGTTNYASADGLLGNQITYGLYPPLVEGFDGTNLLSAIHNWNGTQAIDSFLKFNALSNGTQSAFAGIGGPSGSSICADGTALTSCAVPNSGSNVYFRPTYDSFASPPRWAINTLGTNQIRAMPTGGGSISTITTTAQNIRAFYYRHDASNEIVYYCGSSDGKLHKKDITAGTDTTYAWPISTMQCQLRTLLYNASRNSLIFSFQQNGLFGIAEYVNP